MKHACVIFALFLGMAMVAAEMPPKLIDATAIPDFQIEKTGSERTFSLPQLPPRPDMIVVLRCRMSSFGGSGCNYCARVTVNDTPLGMVTAVGLPRLLFRDFIFHLKEEQYKHIEFKIFKGSNITLPFAKDSDDADRRTTDDLGSWFVFNISDAANPVDVNTVTFRNIRANLGGNITLSVQDVSVGYLPVSVLPKTKAETLNPGRSSQVLTANGTRIDLYRNGGFTVAFPGLPAFVAETGISMKLNTGIALRASDCEPTIKVVSQAISTNTLELTANWPSVRLERILTVAEDGRVDWYDKWTNTDKKHIQGIPLRHRTGLAGTETRNWLSGSYETMEGSFANNGTVFYENISKLGTGCVFVTEDDASERVLDMVNNAGIVEIYSPVLALPPGKSFSMHYSVNSVSSGGYWKFINSLRKRRGVGKYGVERPIFWGAEIPAIPGLNLEQRIQKNLGGLGPITIAFTPWLNSMEREVILDEKQKERPTFEHLAKARIEGLKKFGEKVKLYKRLLPNAKIMALQHPAMRVTYLPEFDKNPLRVSAIRNADSSPYHHHGYDTILLRKKCKEGWAIVYYLPIPGTPAYQQFMESVDFAISCGVDALYVDEYSFLTPRNYRRYDYSAWDGFSADLDDNGNVLALKSDNALAALPFKSALEQHLEAHGKLLLTNGGECGRLACYSKTQGFTEGTAVIYMPKVHLFHVPMVLGNFGTENTRPGVMKAVREVLQHGCVYSPHNRTNHVLEGADNFVCKLYPVTVTEIGSGFVAARERFIARESGVYTWAGVSDGDVEIFAYNEDGIRVQKGFKAKIVNGSIKLEVPPKGLVIAEKSCQMFQTLEQSH
ncbi:MAG: hypothetical protein J5746_04725 [Victivallales bacterium]|nr:hypothetical protein [Victivallales bacterium]